MTCIYVFLLTKYTPENINNAAIIDVNDKTSSPIIIAIVVAKKGCR